MTLPSPPFVGSNLPGWRAAALVCLALLVLQTLAIWMRRKRRRDRHLARIRVAAAGEQAAERHLRDRGFAVLGAQVATEYPIVVDGAEKVIGLRADYLVARGQRRYVVEVKTGGVAPRIDTPATRRQLLEYLLAFEVDGVLLLDMTARSLHEIAFPALTGVAAEPARTPLAAWLGWLACALAIAWSLSR